MVRSTDGGVTWRWRNSPRSPVLGVSFGDANHGCMVGDAGIIEVTTDGGATWHWRARASTTTSTR